MGTKGDGWTTRGVPRLKRLGWGGWVVERNVVVRAKFLAIRRGTERFYPVSPPLYLIRNASHDSSDLFPPFLGIILYIDPGRVEHSSLWTQQRHAASRLVASASRPFPFSPLSPNSAPKDLQGSSTTPWMSLFPVPFRKTTRSPILSNS